MSVDWRMFRYCTEQYWGRNSFCSSSVPNVSRDLQVGFQFGSRAGHVQRFGCIFRRYDKGHWDMLWPRYSWASCCISVWITFLKTSGHMWLSSTHANLNQCLENIPTHYDRAWQNQIFMLQTSHCQPRKQFMNTVCKETRNEQSVSLMGVWRNVLVVVTQSWGRCSVTLLVSVC